jgi:hypothetical protein
MAMNAHQIMEGMRRFRNILSHFPEYQGLVELFDQMDAGKIVHPDDVQQIMSDVRSVATRLDKEYTRSALMAMAARPNTGGSSQQTGKFSLRDHMAAKRKKRGLNW